MENMDVSRPNSVSKSLTMMCLNFTARYGWAELLCRWTLLANPFQCQHIKLCTLFPIKPCVKPSYYFLVSNISSHCCCFQMIDPTGIANWSVTHVDWSEGKWHPKAYRGQDVSYELLRNITVRSLSYPSIQFYFSRITCNSAWVLDIVVTMAGYWYELSCHKQWKGTDITLSIFWLRTIILSYIPFYLRRNMKNIICLNCYYRKKWWFNLVYGTEWSGLVICSQGNFTQKLWITCCISFPIIQQFKHCPLIIILLVGSTSFDCKPSHLISWYIAVRML